MVHIGEKTVDSLWELAESVSCGSLDIKEGARIRPVNGKLLTLTVDGRVMEPVPGKYSGDVVLTLTDGFDLPPGTLFRGPIPVRTAVCVDGEQIDDSRSVLAAVREGEFSYGLLKNALIDINEDDFNGIHAENWRTTSPGCSLYKIARAAETPWGAPDWWGFMEQRFDSIQAVESCMHHPRPKDDFMELYMSGLTGGIGYCEEKTIVSGC